MKKVLSLFAVATFVFAMSSCKKSGTCTCDLGIFGSTSADYTDLNGDEYDAAVAACDAANTAAGSSGTCTWADN